MTELNPITQALLAAIRCSTQPMVLTDPNAADHPMIAVNAAFEAVTGYEAAEAVGRNCRFLQGPGTDPATPGRIGQCIAERRGGVEWIVNYRRDGSAFWNLLFISPVFDQHGTLLHFFGNQRDITKGQPDGMPEYTLGKADMPGEARGEFHALLLDVLASTAEPAHDDAGRARALEALVEAARRLNEVTTALSPAPWSMPSCAPGPLARAAAGKAAPAGA